MSDLDGLRRVHVVGAGGSGMSGIAKVLAQLGHRVTGSDLRWSPVMERLSDLGIDVWSGSRPAMAAAADLVVSSSAIPDADAEIQAARAAGVPTWQRPRLLGALTELLPTVGVTGTHGKTTTTAMLISAFHALGRDPSFVVGGEITGLRTNAHLGDRSLFVLEADEAFGTFLSLRLQGLIVTNVEADHLDHYRDLADIHQAFETVVRAVDGPVLACADDPGAARLVERGAVPYGTGPGAAWRIEDLRLEPWAVRFRLTGGGRSVAVTVPRPGAYVALDAAGVLGLIGELGDDVERAASGLSNFTGVHRRFERRGRINGVTIVDDYAHHPTEIAATVDAARQGSWDRIWAVFQPHRYSRTRALYRDFGASLIGADRVVVTDVYAAGERPEPGVSGKLIADAAIEAGHRAVEWVPHRSELASHLAGRVQMGDLVLTMGAGDITLLGDELAGLLVGAS